MPFSKTLGHVTATLATTAPVLAMVAGLATANIIASDTVIAAQEETSGAHPRRAARAAYDTLSETAALADFTITKDRGARAGARGGDRIVAAVDAEALAQTSRDRLLSRQ
jgi:hypothetical protein